MAKKKPNFLSWTKKKIDKKRFFGSIFVSFLICVLVVFVYTSQPLNKWVSVNIQTLYRNWTQTQLATVPSLTPEQQNSLTQIGSSDRFYIEAGNTTGWTNVKTPLLKPEKTRGMYVLSLDDSLKGRTAKLPIGTRIFLILPKEQIIVSPERGILEPAKGTFNGPANLTAVLDVAGNGNAEIIVQPETPHKTYFSNKLGISFTYVTQVAGRQNFFTREIGNKIFLYYNVQTNQAFSGPDEEFLKQIAPGAMYVEVFNKDPQQTIIDAVKLQFLSGYSEADCIVRYNKENISREDQSFQTVEIAPNIPHIPNISYAEVRAYYDKCPRYETGFGVNYFMMDPKHPNKLLFLRIGQSNIGSGLWGKGTWDATIKVF